MTRKFLVFALTLITATLAAQDIQTIVTSEVTVGDVNGTLEIKIVNDSAFTYPSGTLQLNLPQGISFDAGSLSNLGTPSVAILSSSANAPSFTIGSIALGDEAHFTIGYAAKCNAINYQLGGGIFRDTLDYDNTIDRVNHVSNSYNILYASLSILSVTPSNQTLPSGGSVQRTIQIINGGNGRISTMKLADGHSFPLIWSSVNLGTLNSSKDTASLSGSDFSGVGNNDNYLDNNESITITQTLSAENCSDIVRTSEVTSLWMVDGSTCQSGNKFDNVTIDYTAPSLSFTSSESMTSCFDITKANQQSVTITNNSSGYAQNIELDIYLSSGSGYDASINSEFDISNIIYTLDGGAAQSISPTSSTNGDDITCLGGTSPGQFILDFASLAPGSEIIVYFDMYNCCPGTCSGDDIGGWKAELQYDDACGGNTYNKTNTGQSPVSATMSMFTESDPDVVHGDETKLTYIVSSYDNDLPSVSNGYFELLFNIPAGLKFQNNSDIAWTHSSSSWSPSYTYWNSGSRELTVRFDEPNPFTITKSEVNLTLLADCNESGASAGYKNVTLDVGYMPEQSCSKLCLAELVCQKSVSIYLHCPISCQNGGMRFNGFEALRTSFGKKDNDDNGISDGTGLPDFSKIKRNRVMAGDTFTTVFTGLVDTSSSNPSFSHGYAQSQTDNGDHFTPVQIKVEVYDASASGWKTADSADITSTYGSGTGTFDIDFSASTLSGLGYSEFTGFNFEDGDSVKLTVWYHVSSNPGEIVEENTINNLFYLANEADPAPENRFQCGDRKDNLTLIGYAWRLASKNNVTVNSCTKTINQSYYFGVGDCCSNYNGGNLFPFEYRNWANIAEVKTRIPDNYELVELYWKQWRTKGTNGSQTTTTRPITNYMTIGDTIVVNLADLHEHQSGTVKLSDDGFRGTFYATLAPTCDVPTNTWQDMPWKFKFDKSTALGGGQSPILDIGNDRVKYNPTTLQLTSSNQVQDGLERTVNWNVKITNTTNQVEASNSWLHFTNPTGNLEVVHVIDVASGDTIPISNDIYQVGTINKNSNRNFTVVCYYTACSPENLIVYSGYECSGYPSQYLDFTCPKSDMILTVHPKYPQVQVQISGTTTGDVCSNIIDMTLKIGSVQLASADSLEIVVFKPVSNGIHYIPGSAEIKYPTTGSFSATSDPDSVGSTFTWKLAQMNSLLDSLGLRGVLSVPNNWVEVKWQMVMNNSFEIGDFVQIGVESMAICGDVLPIINLAYDPNQKFDKPTISGITGQLGDSWSVSWADYDGDGDEDIFVTEYDQSTANSLYRNDGSDTFTKITSSPIGTDLASSVSSTWGDFDNDGDPDLFVANNIGKVNFLYRNDGDGTFTKITSGAIANYDGYCHSAAWADYDNDGYLDLFVTELFETAFNKLYRNLGNGTFEEVIDNDAVRDGGSSVTASWNDYDLDGDLDLYVCNRHDKNFFYQNNGSGQLSALTTLSITQDNTNSVGSSWADIDNDGDFDLFVANAGASTDLVFINDGDGTFTKDNVTGLSSQSGNTHGSAFADYDNDGDLDLFIAHDQDASNFLYHNDGTGSFSKISSDIDNDQDNSFGVAWGDYDADGDLDLFVANHTNDENILYVNSRGQCRNSLCYTLQGSTSNRMAIGAKVWAYATIYGEALVQTREVTSQSGGGTGGQSTNKVFFGLGGTSMADSVVIHWPSGIKQTLYNQSTGNCITIIEPSGAQVCGYIFHDSNADCSKDVGEAILASHRVRIMPDNIEIATDSLGYYEALLQSGTYNIQYLAQGNWTSSCDSIDLTVTAGNTYCGNNFGVEPSCPHPDMSFTMSTTVLRRGFSNDYYIDIVNSGGSASASSDFVLYPPGGMTLISSTLNWDSSTDSSHVWNLEALDIGEKLSFIVTDSVGLVPQIGDTLTLTGDITNAGTECNSNNQVQDMNLIVGAIDPNDKQVFGSGRHDNGIVLKGEELTYKIRFENIGNYPATFVTLADTLTTLLDPSTINSLSSSHDYTLQILDGHIMIWKFKNIGLPSVEQDSVGAMGFVQFKISPSGNFHEGALIANRAHITFDYEASIATNEVHNYLFTQLPQFSFSEALDLFPNPAQHHVEVSLSDRELDVTRIDIRDIQGRIVQTLDVDSINDLDILLHDIPPGRYMVEVTTSENFKLVKPLYKF